MPACRSCSTHETTSGYRAACPRTGNRLRFTASAIIRRISSSDRPMARCGASPTMRHATARRCSRPTADRSFSIRIATATGPSGWSAWTAATYARSRATAPGAVYVHRLAEGRHGYLRRQLGSGVFSAPLAPTAEHHRQTARHPGQRQVLQPDRVVAGRHAAGRHTRVGQRPPIRRRHLRSGRAESRRCSPRTKRMR